jgi:hypothetical protein
MINPECGYRIVRIASAAIMTCLMGAGAGQATIDPSGQCELAAARAAEKTGVPLSVLQAIALAESGRSRGGQRRPWPWTVNFAGEGTWYESRLKAEQAVADRQATGATNFDIGCFQINHRWHGDAFPDVAAMFDPDANALYAAEFLMGLFSETGTWPDAAAAYHSRTPEYADRYRARFEQLQAGLGSDEPLPVLATARRDNRFPLLQAGAAGGLGSLVPQVSGGTSLIGGTP